MELDKDFTVHRYNDANLTIIHGDLGVLPQSLWFNQPDGLGALAGALHLPGIPQQDEKSGKGALPLMADSLFKGRVTDLTKANGTFALCSYDKRTKTLHIATDSLGARPIYYTVCNGLLFFSTSISVFERLEMVRKTAEIASYVEQEAICYPMGPRTVYQEIRVLIANEVLTARENSVTVTKYFDWAQLPLANEPVDESAAYCRQALHEAVACRAMPGNEQNSLLSGGLDSRVIVTELLDLGYHVNAFNLYRRGVQDEKYARQFADAAGITMKSKEWQGVTGNTSVGEATARMLSTAVNSLAPGVVFSGDGGGETFGFLLMEASALKLMETGNFRVGVDEYLKKYHFPKKFFQPDVARFLADAANARLERELTLTGAPHPEKAFQIAVLTNDLRCHLHEYFNRITRSKVELLLPFYDRRVLTSVMRIAPPLSELLYHAFYYRVVELFPRLVRSTPWQTYRGRVPCPVIDNNPPPTHWEHPPPPDPGLPPRSLRAALSPGFPAFFRRTRILSAAVLHLMRISDYSYLFKTCINLNNLCGSGKRFLVRDDEAAFRSIPGVEKV